MTFILSNWQPFLAFLLIYLLFGYSTGKYFYNKGVRDGVNAYLRVQRCSGLIKHFNSPQPNRSRPMENPNLAK